MTTQPSDWAVELLPCPFCGGGACWKQGRTTPSFYAACKNCETIGPATITLDTAVTAWNRRAPVARELDASGGCLVGFVSEGNSKRTVQDLPIKAPTYGCESPMSDIIASMRNFADVADEVTVNNAPTAIRNWADMLEASGGGFTDEQVQRAWDAFCEVAHAKTGDEWGEVDPIPAMRAALLASTPRAAGAATTNSAQISSSLVVGEAVDAARYRWLRQFPNNVRAELYAPCQLLMREEHLDAAIDAAMGAVGAG